MMNKCKELYQQNNKELKMKRNNTFVMVMVIGILVGFARMTNAAIIASDDFAYSDGSLTGNNGGTGWSTAYTDGGNSLDVASGQIDESGGPGLVALDPPGAREVLRRTL